TLIHYCTSNTFPSILRNAIANVLSELVAIGATSESLVSYDKAVEAERTSENTRLANGDYSVDPLLTKLDRIFNIAHLDEKAHNRLCSAFSKPFHECAYCYSDVVYVLHQLRKSGMRLGIVSNTPWGAPSTSWRADLDKFNLACLIHVATFCSDV